MRNFSVDTLVSLDTYIVHNLFGFFVGFFSVKCKINVSKAIQYSTGKSDRADQLGGTTTNNFAIFFSLPKVIFQ